MSPLDEQLIHRKAKLIEEDLQKLIPYQKTGEETYLKNEAAQLAVERLMERIIGRLIDINYHVLKEKFSKLPIDYFDSFLALSKEGMDKIYFYDTGARNAIIGNLNLLADRDDAGRLWENFLIVERMKRLAYTGGYASTYFWRTHTGAELDYVEETGGKLYGFEFKYGSKTAKSPASWRAAYPDASFSSINHDTYLPFVLPEKTG